MFKKFLSLLTAMSIVATSATTVVSCGPMTFEKLMNRRVSTDTFYSYYKQPLQSWSTGITMQQEDLKILSNLEDSLMQVDKYGNVIPGTAKKIESSNNTRTWTLTIDENAKWFDYKGNEKGNIKASDVANSMLYAFNPSTTSQTVGLWSMLVKNANQINEAVKKVNDELPGATDEEKVIKNQKINDTINEFISYKDQNKIVSDPTLIVDDKENTVTFNLSKPMPFFDTVLTYVALAPMPSIAVDPSDPMKSFYNYGMSGESYKGIYYSGAYLPVDGKINPSLSVELRKNENYAWADKTFISHIVLNYAKNQDASTFVRQFESGDTSEAVLDPVDTYHWNKYVGKDINDQKFEGAHNVLKPSISTYFFSYNFARISDDSDNPLTGENLRINKVMAQKSVRALISYALDRSIGVSYWSNALDGGSKTSKLLRNIYTAANLVKIDGDTENDMPIEKPSDYTELVQNQYYKNIIKKTGLAKDDNQAKDDAVKMADADDGFKGNDYMAYSALTNDSLKEEFKNAKSYEEKVQVLIKQVKEDLNKFGVEGTTTFEFLANGSNKNTFNPHLNQMFNQFNDIRNNPIQIKLKDTLDAGDYALKQREGKYSIQYLGWSPDFADPTTYLNTVIYGGDYDTYNRMSKVIDNEGKDGKYFLKGKDSAFDQLAKDIETYSNNVVRIQQDDYDGKTNIDRLNDLAEQEAIYTYDNQVIMPFYVNNLPQQEMLSYLDTFSRTPTGFGTAQFKYWNLKMIPKLWTKEEYNQALEEYNKGKEENKRRDK